MIEERGFAFIEFIFYFITASLDFVFREIVMGFQKFCGRGGSLPYVMAGQFISDVFPTGEPLEATQRFAVPVYHVPVLSDHIRHVLIPVDAIQNLTGESVFFKCFFYAFLESFQKVPAPGNIIQGGGACRDGAVFRQFFDPVFREGGGAGEIVDFQNHLPERPVPVLPLCGCHQFPEVFLIILVFFFHHFVEDVECHEVEFIFIGGKTDFGRQAGLKAVVCEEFLEEGVHGGDFSRIQPAGFFLQMGGLFHVRRWAGKDAFQFVQEFSCNALLHLGGSGVGEGEDQKVVDMDSICGVFHYLQNPFCQNGGFSASCGSGDQAVSGGQVQCLLLFFCECHMS